MTRWTQVLVLVALSLVLGGSRCGEDEAVALEALRQDVAPPFDYALYCDANGRLAGENTDVLLVHRTEHLERVYADAQRGDARARALFLQLETQVRASGEKLADQSLGLGCTSLPACTVRWQFLDELMPSRGAGGMRLRHLLAQGFEHEARLKGVENAVIAAVLDVLLVGKVGLAKGARQWLRGLEQPLVMENVGLAHEGRAWLTYVDQFVVDEASLRPGQRPTVHSFSNKQRDFNSSSRQEIEKQLGADVKEALTKYGGMLEVRRPGHPLFGRKVTVSRVHLVYGAKGMTPEVKKTLSSAAQIYDIELHFHAQP